MIEIIAALAVVMAAAVVILLPVSWLLGKMFTTEPPSSAEWLKVLWPDDVMPVPSRGFAIAVTTAVSAGLPQQPVVAASSYAYALSRVGETQVGDPRRVTLTQTTVSVSIK